VYFGRRSTNALAPRGPIEAMTVAIGWSGYMQFPRAKARGPIEY